MTINWVGIDADDTLWHTETHFKESYRQFADIVAPYLGDVVDVHQAAHDLLIETQRRNVVSFGYGIKGATLSMIEAALEASNRQISGDEVYQLLERSKWMMTHPVVLLESVHQALERLGRYRRIMITKGDLVDQRRKIAESNLAHYFDVIEITPDKDAATYAELLGRHGIALDEFVMIGNSLKSDIVPVLEIGGWAVHVPYELTWALEEADLPVGHHAFRHAANLVEAAACVHEIDATGH